MQLDKNGSFLLVFKVGRCFLVIACALFALLPSLACAQVEGEPGPVQIVQPANGSEVIGKKTLIKCNITAPFSKEYLFVYLDGADVTGIIDVSPEGFSFKPVQVLMSGQHQVNVILYTQDGREIQQAFAFSIRHSESFEDLISANQLTARFEGRLKKPDDAVNIPDWKVFTGQERELGSFAGHQHQVLRSGSGCADPGTAPGRGKC